MTYEEIAELVGGDGDLVPIPTFSAEQVDEQDKVDPPDVLLADGPEDAD